MSFIGNVLIVILLLVLVWIIVYNSWVLTYTYDVLKKICDDNVKCGISESEIRVLQTICIISISISIGSLGFMSGGGNVLLFSNISFIYLILFLQLGVVIYNKVVLDSHKNVECPVDKNLTLVNNITLGVVLVLIAIVIFSHLSNKKLKNLKK
jgi:hypothetical protein